MHVQDYITSFKDGDVQITSNISYSQKEIIERNNLIRNSQFENPYFSDGETEKTFYNVLFGFAFSLLRGSVFGTKELVLENKSGKNQILVDIVKLATRNHLELNGFAEKIEEVERELIEMGHVVGKVVNGETHIVNLMNLVMRPDVPIKEGGCAEREYLTYDEALATYGDKPFWKKIKEHYGQLSDEQKPFIYFIEHWTIDEFETDKGKEITKGCVRYLDKTNIDPKYIEDADTWDPHEELERFASPHFVKSRNLAERKKYGEKRRAYPYEEERLFEVKGRSLGMGIFELGRYIQEDYNEKGNFKRKFDQFALRGILVHKIGRMRKTRDGEALTQEFLKRMDTGNALKIYNDESLERLNMGQTTTETVSMMNFLFETLRFMLGITPQSIGQSSSNKTASFAIIQNQTQQSTYGLIKRKTGKFFEHIFQDFLAEDIIENITESDYLSYSGDPSELQEIDRYLAQQSVYRKIQEKSIYTDEATVEKVIDMKTQDLRAQGNVRRVEFKDNKVKKAMKNLIKNLDTTIRFHFTDEALDIATKIRTLLDTDQIQNPKIKTKIMDWLGIPARDMELSKSEKDAQMEEAMKMEQMKMQMKGQGQGQGMNNNIAQPPEVTAQGVQQ
jgi:hypothetical protein